MDGLALKIQDRPVIVLTKKEKYGFLAFHLAHELGHIILGHLNQNTMIVDEKISANDIETENFEQEADEFALELLTGDKDSKFSTDKSYSQMNRLCQSIIKLANEHNIDPLHITLNYGHSNNNFPLARKLLSLLIKQLDIKKTDIDNAYEYYIQNVNLDNFNDEEVILNIIGQTKK